MTTLIRIIDGAPVDSPVTEANFRQLFSDLPALLTNEIVEPLGYGLWDFSRKPDIARYEKRIPAAPTQDENGIWRQAWVVAEMDAAEKANADAIKAAVVRRERNGKLAMCDWTQVADAELTSEQRSAWAVFRSSLRSITEQSGFPWEVVWPTPPTSLSVDVPLPISDGVFG